MKPWNVEICDVTLRDGEQTPGVSFTCGEKQAIASVLDEVGVEVIETGFPVVSAEEKRCVSAIARMGLGARTCCLARALKEDADAAIDCGVDLVSIFIATSDLHIRHKYKRKTREEVLASALSVVEYVHEHGIKVRFAAEDASRTERGFLKHVFLEGQEHGAHLLSFADTVGFLTPLEMYEVMGDLVSSVRVPICAHCHNDMGFAAANTITAAEAGAFQLHTTVNGIGERAGNAPLEAVLVALRLKGGVGRYDLTHLQHLSKIVEKASGIPIEPTHPIVGSHAFAHESGIHIAAILEDPETYEYVSPSLVGGTRKFILGKHTGSKALEHVVSTLGYNLTREQICRVLERVKTEGEHKSVITPEHLLELIQMARSGEEQD
jgi:methanogen homocitrate synthase